MKTKWPGLVVVICLLGLFFAPNSLAQEEDQELFSNHLALSLFSGVAFPTGDFADPLGGNRKIGPDVALEVEYYFSEQASMGLAIWGAILDDKNLGDILQTTVATAGGFVKYTLPSNGDWHPYGKFGLGVTSLEFEAFDITIKSESALGILLTAGVLNKVSDLISVNGQFSYNHSSLKDAAIKGIPNTVVGFDVQYIAIDIGISFFFTL